jgi:hypothetical protein
MEYSLSVVKTVEVICIAKHCLSSIAVLWITLKMEAEGLSETFVTIY